MKARVWVALASATLLMNIGLNPVDSPHLNLWGGVTAQAGVRVDFGFFYNELSPFGDWRQVEPYGWVWYPDVAGDWRPYTFGYWVFTDDYGWTWISTDPWGSIPFHYGRWFYDRDGRSWAWVPDTEWGPAWVGWRQGEGFIGWAPLPPDVAFDRGVGFAPTDRDFGASWNSWSFVPTRRFLNRRLERVIMPRPRSADLLGRTVNITQYAVVNGRIVNRSINRTRFEDEARVRVMPYQVDETDRPVRRGAAVRDGRVLLFRPEVVRATTVAPPPPADRPHHRGRPFDQRFERHSPDPALGEQRPNGGQDRWDRGERPGMDRPSQNGPSSIDLGAPNRQRPGMGRQAEEEQHPNADQERTQRQAEREARQQVDQRQQQQQTDQERAQRQAEREARQQERAQRQAEREARQQVDQRQQQQTDQERAQHQAEREARQREQAQRQAEREARQQADQRQQQQAEQERARQQALQQQQLQQQQAEQERARQQAEQERVRQQALQQQQLQQQQAEQARARQQAEQERAQRQVDREQRQHEHAQRQAEREQRQQERAQRQAEREARQQATPPLPECKSLPPGQQQNCR